MLAMFTKEVEQETFKISLALLEKDQGPLLLLKAFVTLQILISILKEHHLDSRKHGYETQYLVLSSCYFLRIFLSQTCLRLEIFLRESA